MSHLTSFGCVLCRRNQGRFLSLSIEFYGERKMKCYLIYHIHIFEDGSGDYKTIGIFSSYDKALEVKEKYSSELLGFKDFSEGFCIEEFEVTGLDITKQRMVYVIFTYIYKNGEEEELSVIGIVKNQEEAKKIIKKYKLKNKIKKNQYFEYEKYDLNENCWQEGFITYECKYKGNT